MDLIVNSVLSRCNTDRKYGRFTLALCSQSMGEVKQGVNYQPKPTRQLTILLLITFNHSLS